MGNFSVVFSAGWTLALRNIKIQVREHALGYAWTFIIPMLYAVCYILIKREISGEISQLSANVGWDLLRAFAGITLFQYWMQAMQDTMAMIRRQREMLRGLDVGPAPFVMAIMFEGMVSLAIRVLLIFSAIPLLGLSFPGHLRSWVISIISILVLYLSSSAIGLILAPWATLYGDVRKAVQSMTLPLILISPIFYDAIHSTDSMLYWLNVVNPLASPLAVLADSLQGNPRPFYLLPMFVWGGVSVMLLVWSIKLLRRQVPVLLERMGN